MTALWLAATIEEPNGVQLIDDGQWHSYSIPFAPEFIPGIANGNFRIMIEDWCGRPPDLPQGVSGDAFFDNIELFEHHVPIKDTSWGAIKKMYW